MTPDPDSPRAWWLVALVAVLILASFAGVWIASQP